MLPPNFLRPIRGVVLRDSNPNPARLRLRDYHLLRWAVLGHFNFSSEGAVGPYNPTFPHSSPCRFSLSFSLFARCYWGNLNWFLFLSLLGCFRSGGPRSISERRRYHPRQEVLFGYLRIEACMRLPGAYRSLPRPSSVPKPSHPSGGLSCRTYFGTHISFNVQRPMHGVHRNRSSPLDDYYTLRFPTFVEKLHQFDLGSQSTLSLYCLPVRST